MFINKIKSLQTIERDFILEHIYKGEYMSNEEKIEFNVMLDIAQEEQEKKMNTALHELKTIHSAMIDNIFEYFIEVIDKPSFKQEFYTIVSKWYLQDPIQAKIWVEENNKEIESRHEMQLRYDI
tara:strand:+ start:294 stop:665 length:372 start_codon:yes stop_codon:yes gene_type:complete